MLDKTMTTVFVPAEKVASLNLKFRFVDDPPNRRPRMGNICQIGIPHVRTPRKDYEYRDKKYHQLVKSVIGQLNFCIGCPSQATNVLIFKSYYDTLQLQKYCNSCLEKNVIRL